MGGAAAPDEPGRGDGPGPRADDSGARDAVEALVEAFFEARREGSAADVDDFSRRVPGREAEFRELVGALDLLEGRGAKPAPPMPQLRRFRLVRRIGRGGMGAVYEAVDAELDRHVALKLLPGHAALEEREVARFRREAQAAARLRHPHIVPIFGVGQEDGTHWIAMQLIGGASLDRRMRQGDGRPFAPAEVARLGAAIADALAYAHAEGVLHRDVKPSNVLVDESGVAFVTDFGLAKSEGAATLTRTGETVGTPRYMAPEAFEGWADPRTDVWGVGATLFELLAGQPAFDGVDRARLLRQIREIEPTPLRRLRPELPRDIATIVARCLQKEATARYATARELADDLRRFLAGEPVRARPPSLAYRASLVARRHPTATLLLAGAITAGAAMTALAAAGARAAEKRANDRFAALRKLAGSFLFEFHDAIRDLPGSTPARALVARRALEYLGELANDAADDAGLRRDLAEAYQKVGDVQGNPYQPNLGDTAGARASFRKSIDLLDPVVARGEATDDERALLASAYLAGGGIEQVAGATARAIEMSARGLALRRELAARAPDAARRSDLANACQFHAFNLSAAGRNDEALAVLREQADLLAALRREAPDDLTLKRADGQNRYLVARQHDLRGEDAAARAGYGEALALQRALIAADPKSTRLRRDLCWTLGDLAILERRCGDAEAAVDAHREILDTSRELAAADPSSTDAALAVARACNNLGTTLDANVASDEVLDNFEEAIRICEPIVAADPLNSYAARLLAKACAGAAYVRGREGDAVGLTATRALHARALALLEVLDRAGKLNAEDRGQIAIARIGIAACDKHLSALGR